MTDLPAPPPSTRPPLGLPSGSVRALLTMLVVATVVTQIVRNEELAPLWTETLLIALAHYFTTRRFINLPPEVLTRLERDGYVDAESHPLFLPRTTVRLTLLATFLGLTIYLYRRGQLWELQALSLLGVVFAYLLGYVTRHFVNWLFQGKRPAMHAGWEDFKAICVLALMAYTAGVYLCHRPDLAPHLVRNTALGLVLFYFGSR